MIGAIDPQNRILWMGPPFLSIFAENIEYKVKFLIFLI